MTDKEQHLYSSCLAKSAQAWCSASTESTIMDSNIATEFANILVEPVKIMEELVSIVEWMSGSEDFSPEGQAFKGWLSFDIIVKEKLDHAKKYFNELSELINN